MYNPAPSFSCLYVSERENAWPMQRAWCTLCLLEEKQFSIFKFNFVMEDLMHTMSLVHIVRQGCSMPSVLFFILAEQKNEQHTPIILFTPNICNESEGNLFVLNNLLSIFLFLDDETLLPCRLETTHIYYLEIRLISFFVRLKNEKIFFLLYWLRVGAFQI